ncbi:MAG: tetratricopeptide repeat protein [Candidatus Accumulibacter sp.]|uniref:Tetratricopeptide repeat protein n=1 Tax=Candidatus Accumulibacter affinis TaxID=2954384 RepID=A0A935TES3_9PROT|nr:tetratricopeptide repeat protein [Candidatus Accumulibacter affinis]
MIFISYRRSDAGGHAGRLFDRLRQWFAADTLFYDQDGIDIGDTFPERIEQAIGSAAVVLVLIGPDWLAEINRRAAQPGVDFVRREVELALTRQAEGALVLPVLPGGAAMPSPDQLHIGLQASLAPLCALDAHVFQGKQADWENQFVRLRERIARVPGIAEPRFRAPAGVEPPYRVIEHALSPHFQDPNGLLARLHGQLVASGSASVLARAALHGMGGVGKTQLALKYSREYRDLHAGVWWFRAESETSLQLDAQDACQAAGAMIQPGELPAIALKRWLERQETRWLLVYDNAEEVAALRPYLPGGGKHHLLITSRNPAWGGLATPVEMAVWTAEQGAEFLAARLQGAAQGDLRKLAGDLGGLPLALEQAASYLEETGLSVADYRALLAGIETEGLILDEGRAATGYERSLAATLSLAFEKLTPAAQQLLRLCAFAAPELLPERFFQEAADQLPPELAAAAANPLAWNRVAGELRRYGLAQRLSIPALDRAPGGASERSELALSLHRLTQQTTRAWLAQPEHDCKAFDAVLVASCPMEASLPANWPRHATLTQHVTQLDRYYDAGWLETRQFSWLLDRTASYLRDGPALYGESAHWFRRALAINIHELGDEHPDTLTSMNNLALTLRSQGDLPGARALQEQVLAIRRRVLGDEHPDTLSSMANLASTLRSQGDLPGARALEEQVLAISHRVLGDEHPDTLTSMNNLASTLQSQGDLPGARALQEQVLALRRRVLGDEHPDTLTSMGNLASTLRSQGDLPGARALQEQVLAISRRILGDEHPNTLTSMGNLASTLWSQGDLPGARALEEQVLALRRRVLGDEHPDTLSSMNNLASTLRSQGDLPGARALQEQVLAISCRVLGDEHPDTLNSMGSLALTLGTRATCRRPRASGTGAGDQLPRPRRRTPGHPHQHGSLAWTLWKMDEYLPALQLMQAAAEGLRRKLGPDHPDTIGSRQAVEQMQAVLPRGRRIGGKAGILRRILSVFFKTRPPR